MDFDNLPWYGQFLITLVIMLVILGLFYWVFYSKKKADIDRMETAIKRTERKIIQAQRKINKLKEIEKGIAKKRDQLRQLKKILPDEKEVAEVLKRVQAIISDSKLELVSSQEGKEQTIRNVLKRFPLSIEVRGKYHNLAIFFDQLSELDKIFTVDNLQIAPIRSRGLDIAVYSILAKFVASTYYLIPEAEQKAAMDSAKKKKGRRP